MKDQGLIGATLSFDENWRFFYEGRADIEPV